MQHVIATLIALTLPVSVSAASLSDVIADYVTTFDASTLNADEQARIVGIHNRANLAHGMKVLLVHDVLLKAEALEHENIHSTKPEPVQMSAAD